MRQKYFRKMSLRKTVQRNRETSFFVREGSYAHREPWVVEINLYCGSFLSDKPSKLLYSREQIFAPLWSVLDVYPPVHSTICWGMGTML